MSMKKGKKKRLRIFAGVLAALLGIMGGLEYSQINAYAVLDESTAVKYSTFSLTNTVENGTLFVGTYLIHMTAMTDELYEKAQESAEDSGQYNIYYKSELANGEWFDISSAEGLADITDAAEPVETAELDDLWVTFYVGADGIAHSAKNSESVCIFDQPSPYDLYRLPELEALRNQYDNTYTSETEGADRYFYDQLKDFFGLNLRNAVTDECDRQINLLQGVYNGLQQQEKSEQAEILYTLMGKIDAKRRAEVFYQLMEAEDSRLNQLQSLLGGSAYHKENYNDEQFVASADLSDAVGTAMESCESSYITHSGNQIANDGTVLGETEYTLCMSILEKAAGGNTDLEEELLKLKNLYSIKDSMIKDKDKELTLLEQELIPKAEERLKSAFSSGAGQEYNAAVSQGKSKEACDKLLELQKTEQDKISNEYRFLLEAKTERMDSQEAVDYLFSKIEEIGNCYSNISDDAYAENAQLGVDACLLELQQLAQGVIDGDSSMRSTLSGLENDKENTQTLRDAALDKNDLGLAKKYDAMLDAIDVEIAAEEQRLAAQLNSSSAVDRAKAMTQLGDKTRTANAAKIQNNAKKKLAEGDMSGIVEAADALAALGEEDALKDLMSSIGTDASDDVRNALSSALQQVQGSGNSTESGNAADGFGLTGDELLALLESALGDSFDNMNDKDQAAVLGALGLFGAEGSSEAGTLAVDCMRNGNKNLFVRYSGSGAEKYISAQTIGRVTDFRYIYSASRRDAVLSGSGKTYRYSVGSSEVRLTDGTIEQMSSETVLQGNVAYIPEEAGSKYFGCSVIYIEGTEYAVCVTEGMEATVEQLLEKLKGGTD
nr:MAG TPA_asm: copper amine oxidase [Caudoviricetes sp.]